MDERSVPKLWFVPDERTFADISWGGIGLSTDALLTCSVGTLTAGDESLGFHGHRADIALASVRSIQLITTDRTTTAQAWALRIAYGTGPSVSFLYDARAFGNHRKRMVSVAETIRGWLPRVEVLPERHIDRSELVGTKEQRRADRVAQDRRRGVDKVPLDTPMLVQQNVFGQLSPWVRSTWGDVAADNRETVEALLKDTERPFLVGWETGARRVRLHVATDRGLILVWSGQPERGSRYEWDGVRDLRPGRGGSIELTYEGEAVKVKPTFSYLWVLADRLPQIVEGILVGSEELAAAPPDRFAAMDVGCLKGAQKVERSFMADVLLNEQGTGQYIVFSIPVLKDRATGGKEHYQPAACAVCGTRFLIRVQGGVPVTFMVYDGPGWPVDWEHSGFVQRVGGMQDVVFKQHGPAKLLRWR